MSKQMTTHKEELVRLRRIEGQIRGVQKMIEEERYCIDLLTQISSIVGAIKSVEENILTRHLQGCVQHSFNKGTKEDKRKKVDEVCVGMSDPPGHFVLFCKLQKGGLRYAKRSQRGIQSPFQMDSS